MTLEQLAIFVAVAEREHLTRAAEAIHLTPSAVSSAIRALERQYDVALFDRVGRRIALTEAGRVFLDEARATLARAEAAELVLGEVAGLRRGALNIAASQTAGTYWLPPLLMRLHAAHPGLEIRLRLGNTRFVADAVLDGSAEIGFVEGAVSEPALVARKLAEDALVVVVAPDHPFADKRRVKPAALVSGTAWVMREPGSGTRSEFEAALAAMGVEAAKLNVALTLPSNEAVLSAVAARGGAAAVSSAAAEPLVSLGRLVIANLALPRRAFLSLRHRERRQSHAAATLEALCLAPGTA